MADQWYVGRYTPTGEQKSGPMALEQLQQMAATRQLGPADLVFREGTAGWVPASNVPELTGHLQTAPARSNDFDRMSPHTPRKSGMPTGVVVLLVVGGGLGVLFLIVIVCLAAITTVGQNASMTFSQVGSKLEAMPQKKVPPQKYQRLQFERMVRGKSEQEVLEVLGAPARKDSAFGELNNVWIYEGWLRDNNAAHLRFDDDKVVDISYELP